MKICNACKQEKPMNDYHKNIHKVDGRQNTCKLCIALKDKKRRKVKQYEDQFYSIV